MDFDQLYKDQFPVVYRYLTGLCGNQALAEELAQETFCRAIEHSASFQGKCPPDPSAAPCSARAIPGGVYPAGFCGTTLYADRRIVWQI